MLLLFFAKWLNFCLLDPAAVVLTAEVLCTVLSHYAWGKFNSSLQHAGYKIGAGVVWGVVLLLGVHGGSTPLNWINPCRNSSNYGASSHLAAVSLV